MYKKKSNFFIITTNDYEVYGDGTGNAEDVLIRPTYELLKECDDYGVPMTLFVDVLEYLVFRKAEDEGVFGEKYTVASRIERQLKEAKQSGHDVQLHLHPQWIGAEPVNPDKWLIKREFWRLPFVPGGIGDFNNPESLRGLFNDGKKLLEKLLKPVDPAYACIAFRAGGYCIQPETEVLAAMAETGFMVESSVCPGKRVDKGFAAYDFRDASQILPYWKIEDSVSLVAPHGPLLEIPVFTARRPHLSFMHPSSLLRQGIKGIFRAFRNRMFPLVMNFDYCKLSASEMKQFLFMAMQRLDGVTGPIPIVITGHSKEYRGEVSAFTEFLAWASDHRQIEFVTYGGFLNKLHEFELSKSVKH